MAGFVPFWLTGFDDDYLSNGMAYATVLNIPWLKKNPLCSSALIALPVFFFILHSHILASCSPFPCSSLLHGVLYYLFCCGFCINALVYLV